MSIEIMSKASKVIVSGLQGPIAMSIIKNLDILSPSYIEIHNESKMHSKNPSGETHFKIVVVSDAFKNLSLLNRHRLINNAMNEIFSMGLHSLSIAKAISEDQFDQINFISSSPPCLGGSKFDK